MIDTRLYRETERQIKIFIAAGEVSGDRQAAHLSQAILRQQPNAYLFGSGGDKMREAGVDVRIQTSHLGCIGFQESLRFMKPLRKVSYDLRTMVHAERPDLAILVDHERFNTPLARRLFTDGVPFIYYFPPQVAVWGEWRAKIISKRARAIIPAFPADAEIYQREGGRVQWFGHPLVDIVTPETNADEILLDAGLNPSRRTIALMPGSRFQEVEALIPSMVGAARLIKHRYPDIQIILPLAAPHLLPTLMRAIKEERMADHITLVSDDVYTFLSRCSVVILASGTATLEVALLAIPMVIGYKVKPITYHIIKNIINTRFIGMPNILLNEPVIPELLQGDVTAERFAAEAFAILDDESRSRTMQRKLMGIRPLLGKSGVLDRTATFVLDEARRAHKHDFVAVV